MHGFRVILASSGREALDLYFQRHEEIALVLTDIQMPDLDGPSTLDAFQQINPEVRCCFRSRHPRKYNLNDLTKRGAFLIWKPFSMSKLADLLYSLLPDRDEGLVQPSADTKP